jgi:hypothetical protein
MTKILSGLLLLFPAFNLLAQQKVTYTTYTDPKEQVSIKYPATWEHKPYSTSVFMFMRPVEEKGQKFRENINLVVGPAQDLYLVEYLADARKKMNESMEGFKELKSEYIKINGLDFVRMVYEFTNSKLVIKSVLYLAIHNDKAYSLNCTALDNTFDRFYPLFETMAKSFKIK